MIELKYVEKRYPGSSEYLYVDSLTINKGEIVGILGGNGSGKTTLLKAIMGIVEIQNGTITVEGRPVTEQYDNIALITEEGSFLPDLTPVQYAEFLAGFFPRFNRKHFDKLISFYELEPQQKIKTFSKGQKLKLEICAGFAKDAKYMLMDEPFQGKDMFTRKDFLKLMVSNLKGDETILLTTHLIEEIEHVIDRAIIVHKGRIKADFYIDEMREQGKSISDVMSEVIGYKENKYKEALDDSFPEK